MDCIDDTNDMRVERSPRVLAYCHDGVGLGHLRRSLNICEHLGQGYPQASFLIATGSPYVSLFKSLPRVDFLKLPSLNKVDNHRYEAKYLSLDSDKILGFREALLKESVRHFAPHIVLVDKAPVGVCGELKSTLSWIRENRPKTRIVFGMRDIEDSPDATIKQWSRLGVQASLEECFDEVWVYGVQNVFDVVSKYRLSDRIRDKLLFTGYVAREACDHDSQRADYNETASHRASAGRVVVTVGAGTDGTFLLDTYLREAALRTAAKGYASVIVAGPDLAPDAATRLSSIAAMIRNVHWVDFAPCMACHIKESDLVVCMGGYNTLCEVVRCRKPALVFPRTTPRVEQALRANLWAKRGVVSVLPNPGLTPGVLADRVEEMLEHGGTDAVPNLDLGGLNTIRRRFNEWLNGGVDHAIALSM